MQRRCHPQVLLAWLGSANKTRTSCQLQGSSFSVPNEIQLGNPASDVLLKLNCLVDRKSEPILTIPNPKPGSRFLYRYFGLQF